ncbi:MAG: alpha/beta hydrolase fold domain-containing protein [Beijerinckiaceae bacterium]|jgi:acetyl esterase|nr:alpha/beta hydrolase fold domain-containing protein [Beijerinckiaceae bacterium]
MKRFDMRAFLLAGCALMPAAALAQTTAPRDAASQEAAPKAAQQPPTISERASKVLNKVTGNPLGAADTDMNRVLSALADLDPKPIETLSPEEARKQPTVADAAKALLTKEGKPTAPEPGVTTKDISIDGPGGPIKARIYKPDGATGPLPVVLYFHGGGWVIADLDVYDSSPRALAKDANVIVVSSHYRQAPENKFPAAHEDAVAAYQWLLKNAEAEGGDAKRIGVMGESAGGNLAINVAIAARDKNLQMPAYQVLVYPVAGVDMNTASYKENENAKPLNKAMMGWFVEKVMRGDQDKMDPRIDLVGKADVSKLPPTSLITAQIDPLRSEGQALALKLEQAGVRVKTYDVQGVAHEFYGLGAVVADARRTQVQIAEDFKTTFGAAAAR